MSNRWASFTASYLLFAGMLATSGPSPLYPLYAKEFHFSAFVLTLVYAAYAAGVLVALLGLGPLSDRIGRKPVLLAASVLLVLGTVVMAAAQGVAWLFIARLLQGFALGNIGSASTAALVELNPGRDRAHAAMLSTLAFTSGAGTGSIMFGLFAQYLPWPIRLAYAPVLVAGIVAVVLAARLPDSLATSGATSLRRVFAEVHLQRPVVPRSIVRPCVAAFLAAGAAWSVSGIYAALSPSMVAQLLHDHSHVVAGIVLLIFFILSGTGQVLSRLRSSHFAIVAGLLGTAGGVGLLQIGVMTTSGAVFAIGAVLSGLGFGMAFIGTLGLVNEVAPVEQRAEVVSTYNIAGYGSLSLPVIGVGLLASPIGLTAASGIFTLVILVATAVALVVVVKLPPSHRGVIVSAIEPVQPKTAFVSPSTRRPSPPSE